MILLQESLREAFFCKTWEDWYISLNFVELPDNLLEIIKGMRGSPSVESPGKLCEMKALDKGLPKKCRSRKIDSMFPVKDVMLFDKLGLEKVLGRHIGLTSLKFGVFPRWDLV
jgi:hypothetical protein